MSPKPTDSPTGGMGTSAAKLIEYRAHVLSSRLPFAYGMSMPFLYTCKVYQLRDEISCLSFSAYEPIVFGSCIDILGVWVTLIASGLSAW